MIPVDTDSSADPRELFRRTSLFARRVLRFWYIPLFVLFAGGFVWVGLDRFLKPAYRSEVVILATEGVRPVDAAEQASAAPRSVAARIQEIVTSRPQLSRAIEQFDLYPDIRRTLGPVDAVDELRKHVQFRALGGDTFKIAFDGTSPPEAQKVTSRLAELVIEEDSRLRKEQAKTTQEFFLAEKAKTEAQLSAAEQELASFIALHPRFAVDTTPLANGAAVRASQGGAPLVPLGRAFPTRVATAAPRSPSQPDALPAEGLSPMDRAHLSSQKASAEATLAAARADLADKLAHFMPAHPDVRLAQAAVQRAEAQLASFGPAAGRSASPAADAPGASELATVPPKPEAMRNIAVAAASSPAKPGEDLVALETTWDRLTRALIEVRQRHAQIEVALFKADIGASSEWAGNGTRMTVIDPAYLPQRPVPPGRLTIAAIVGAIALALGLLIAIGCAAFDDRIYTDRDVDGIGYVLVEVPRIRMRRRAHVTN